MAFIRDATFDAALNDIISGVTTLYITDSEATSYADASTAPGTGSKLGTKATFSLASGNPQNGAVSGRRILVPAITDGTVDTSGTATHWALCSGSVLYATGQLSSSQAVTAGNTFTLAAFSITFPDAT